MSINGEIIRLGNCSLSGKNLCKSKLVTENQVCLWENHVELTREEISRYVWALFQMPLFINGRQGFFFVFLLVYVIGDIYLNFFFFTENVISFKYTKCFFYCIQSIIFIYCAPIVAIPGVADSDLVLDIRILEHGV